MKPFCWSAATTYTRGNAKMMEEPACYVNGEWVREAATSTAPPIAVEDPCTHEVIGTIPCLGATEAHAAIDAAQTAFESWKTVMPRERSVKVRLWADLILQHQDTIGAILSRESGKVIAEGVGEVVYAQRFVEWYAGEAERIYGDIIPGPRPGVQTTVLKEPIGVVGIITPWNFPAAMITRAAAGAIAAGCSVVVKPSELTPFTALALAQLAEEAGIPPGVFNVITGDAAGIGGALVQSPIVRKISFTGSTRVGKKLYRESAETVKKIGMELGGNAPFLVFEDAELPRAVDALIAAKFRNAGQTCICCNRAFVHASIYDTFKAMVVEKVKQLKVGDNFDPSVKIGSLISQSAKERVTSVIADAVEKGATVLVGGDSAAVPAKGWFVAPTVLENVSHDESRCCQEEIFGPVLPLIKFETEEEAVQMANATTAGLAAYFFTTDYRRQHRVARALRYGMVGVNDSALSSPCAPFGGVKESGLGRDGSKYGIEPFVDVKYVLFSTV